ncbi:MAG TPA: hypothetical protein VK177_19885 [Flavobacteriales bacterium]|nr:hypothetical protein [Flavobacteriales bacterium]
MSKLDNTSFYLSIPYEGTQTIINAEGAPEAVTTILYDKVYFWYILPPTESSDKPGC